MPLGKVEVPVSRKRYPMSPIARTGFLLCCFVVILTGSAFAAQPVTQATNAEDYSDSTTAPVESHPETRTVPLSVLVFDGGKPVSGIALRAGDETLAVSDADGAMSIDLPADGHDLVLQRGDQVLGGISIDASSAGAIQILATLPNAPDGEVDFDVEGAETAVRESAPQKSDVAQGEIAGRIRSAETGEPVPGAQVYFSGVSTRAATNDEGTYQALVPAGNYQISVVHPEYSSQTLDEVTVPPRGKATRDIELSPAGLQLVDYVVTAPHIEGSVASVFSEQREGSGVSEVLGVEQMKRAGDSNAADALKRVTGLTIEDGKYVVIRGQPSRYTLTLWNGSPLPSPEPIRRIVPLDLFPTGVLSRIHVEKSYDAAVPGSFGGGLILLETAGVPDKNFAQLSAKTGMNTITTFQDGLTYEGGGKDWLGFDDGTREMPPGLFLDNRPPETERAAAGFNNTWNVSERHIGPDFGLGASLGGRIEALGGEFGVLASGNWEREFSTRETVKRDFNTQDDGSLIVRNDQLQTRTDMEIDVGGLLVGAAEWEKHKFRSNTFLIRKSTKRTEISEGTRRVSDDLFVRDYLLEWRERELFAEQLVGEHDFEWVELEWRGMLADSSSISPDRRNYIYTRNSEGDFLFFNQAKGQRRFTESKDDILSFDADLGVPVVDSPSWTFSMHGGASVYTQERQSQARRFSFEAEEGADLTAGPEQVLDPSKLGGELSVQDQTQTNDSYLGDASVQALYLKGDVDWSETVRIALGARQEYADFLVRTFVAGGSKGGKPVEGGFEDANILPFASVTWRFVEKMQARLSGARTLSRPVLNELSPARYFDPDSGEEFQGNPELQPAVIDALDMRWEWYPSGTETITAGVFLKDYEHAIEQSFIAVGGSSFLRQVQNAAGATVRGLELSGRADFTRLVSPFGLAGDWSDRIYLAANATFITSEVELARQDLATNKKRPLQGQADTLYNLQLGYDGETHDADLSYNRVGERLFLAGVKTQPDVYQVPLNQLDVTYGYSITDNLRLKAKAGNLLDPKIEFLQGDKVFRSFQKGRDYSLSISARI